jgi:hypothetical protein
VIDKDQHPGKKFVKQFHRRSSLVIFFRKDNHQLDRRWMQQKTEEGNATVVCSSYPQGGKERRDFSPAPPGCGWAARRAKSWSSCSTLWITQQRIHSVTLKEISNIFV